MIKKIAVFVFVCAVMVASFGVASKYIIAQDGAQLAAKNVQKNIRGLNLMDEEELLAIAFPNNKHTCVTKSGLFMAVSKAYQDGETLEEMIPMSIMKPVLEGYYNEIKEAGVVNAHLNNIQSYQDCVKSAKPHKDKKREKELRAKHKVCVKFADAVLYALDGIKSRKSIDTVLKRYENNALDMTGTAFSNLGNPVFFFVGQIYNTAQKKSYEEAVKMGHGLTVACGA